jgi:hypothetical protein
LLKEIFNPAKMKKFKKIIVNGTAISIIHQQNSEFISLTDMSGNFKNGGGLIEKWITTKNTLEYLSIWESINNGDFNYPEFGVIERLSGVNRFSMSAGQWIKRTKAIGLIVNPGRYGGTFAHKDIAFHFAMWLSPEFQIYLIKEFQRLKIEESDRLKLDWNLQRSLSKINYHIHTDAIKQNLIPKEISGKESAIVYASEADVLNMALFGKTAAQWRFENAKLEGNIRDHATLEQLVVLTNLESINAVFIKQGLSQQNRLIKLNKVAIDQICILIKHKITERVK